MRYCEKWIKIGSHIYTQLELVIDLSDVAYDFVCCGGGVMRKAVMSFRWSSASEGVSALAVATVFYAFGSILGGMFAVRLSQDSGTSFYVFLENVLLLAQTSELMRPDLLRTLLSSLRWLVAVLILSLSVIGIFGLPVLCGVRGFLLSFSVWAFSSLLGREGWSVAVLLVGLSGLFSVPIFLLTVVQGYLRAKSLMVLGTSKAKSDFVGRKQYFMRWILLACILCSGLIVEWYLLPGLLTGLSKSLLK